jgi:hypothetical protein
MESSEFDLGQCLIAAGQSYANNIVVVLLTALVLPLPGFLFWHDAPLVILCIELTLLDCFYLMAGVLLIYGIFGSPGERISIATVLSPFMHPQLALTRCWQFYFTESPGIWQSLWAMILGIIFGLGAQWLAAPWKIPLEQNLIAACVYAACLVLFSQDLVGWMLAPYYLPNLDVPAKQAYKSSHFSDKEHNYWNLRLAAVLCLLLPVLLDGLIRYLVLTPAEFENYRLNLPLFYLTSIVPWMLAVFGLFVWHEIYRQRIGQTAVIPASLS